MTKISRSKEAVNVLVL